MRTMDIYFTRAFEGMRHERCYRIWKMFAAAAGLGVRVVEVPPQPGLRHAEIFTKIWHFARYQPAEVVVLTEADFLPTPDFAKRVDEDLKKEALGVEYITRDPQTLDAIRHTMPGGWLVALDNAACAEKAIDFDGGGSKFNDPGNDLHNQLDMDIWRGRNHEFGLMYPAGEHMFWSRHYNEPAGTIINGFSMDAVKQYVDETLDEYEDLYGI